MSETPVLDELDSLGLEGHRLEQAILDVAGRIRREQRRRRRPDVHALVAGYLGAHPDASANEVCRHVGGVRRRDVLQAVRELRGPAGPVPVAGNQPQIGERAA